MWSGLTATALVTTAEAFGSQVAPYAIIAGGFTLILFTVSWVLDHLPSSRHEE